MERGGEGETKVKNQLEQLGYKCESNKERKNLSYFDITIEPNITIEIKNDFWAKKSGNIAIEFFNSKLNKPSGITITKSDIWCHIIDGEIFVVATQDLKNFVHTEKPKRIVYKAGDGNADLMLFSIEHIMKIFRPIKEIQEIICGLGKNQNNKMK